MLNIAKFSSIKILPFCKEFVFLENVPGDSEVLDGLENHYLNSLLVVFYSCCLIFLLLLLLELNA